jgi:hypothetical protein
MRAMAREPADRHQEARLLASDLREFLRGTGPDVEPLELAHYLAELFPEAPEATGVPRPTAPNGDESIEIVFDPAGVAAPLQKEASDTQLDQAMLAAGSPAMPPAAEPAPVPAPRRVRHSSPPPPPPRGRRGTVATPRGVPPRVDVDIFPEPTRVAPAQGGRDVFATYTRAGARPRRQTGPAFFGAAPTRRDRSWPFATSAEAAAGTPAVATDEASGPIDSRPINEAEDARRTEQ